MKKVYDLAIVGGGIAGLSLASSLLHSPVTRHLSIALIEGNTLSTFSEKSPTSNRTSSLTPTSVRYLQATTAWGHVLHNRLQQYTNMHVYDGVSDQQIEFQQTEGIATMSENQNLQSALLRSLEKTALSLHIEKVEQINSPESKGDVFPTVVLSGGHSFQTRLLVGADGANSPVRSYAGIESRGWDYPHHGVVSTMTHNHSDYSTAHQRMLPSGPIAFLPLSGDKAGLVWSIHPKSAALLKSLPSETMTEFVNAAFRLSYIDLKYILNLPASETHAELKWRLSLPSHSKHAPPLVVRTDSTASFPLKFRHTGTYHADRVVLIGDAAHTIHPLAGQGLNLALLDSASLQRAIQDCVESGGDIGNVGSAVTRDRYWANARVGGVVDKMHKLYAREEPTVVGLRSLGSALLNQLEVLKRSVMSAAG